MFSRRTVSEAKKNRLTLLLEQRRGAGAEIIDLTESNPTRVGIVYPREEILGALVDPRGLEYRPAPFGLPEARGAVMDYYKKRASPPLAGAPTVNNAVSTARTMHGVGSTGSTADDVVLTASTSEAYAFLFKLLADPGDAVLAPRPSYPLFDFLAAAESVEIHSYPLVYESGWRIDADELAKGITSRTRALVLVHPNNPTGSFVKRSEWARIQELCEGHGLAVICDEVFWDYRLAEDTDPFDPMADAENTLMFLLNGLSKVAGLPQMKLGWMVLRGPEKQRADALHRLEIVSDTFLSVNTPVQYATPALLQMGETIRRQIQERLRRNLNALRDTLAPTAGEVLQVEGGWYAVIRVPQVLSEEEWTLRLLGEHGLLVHPGYFYDFPSEAYLVLSLLTPEALFQEGIDRLKTAFMAL